MSGSTEVRRYGAVRVVKHGVRLSDAAKALARRERLTYEAALDRVVRQRPELYEEYLDSISGG